MYNIAGITRKIVIAAPR